MAGPNARRGGFAKPAQQNVPGSLSRKVALEPTETRLFAHRDTCDLYLDIYSIADLYTDSFFRDLAKPRTILKIKFRKQHFL